MSCFSDVPPTRLRFSKLAYRNAIQMTVIAVAVDSLSVMTPTPATPNPVYGLGHLLAATAVLFGGVLTALVAVDYPLVVATVAVAMLVAAVATTLTLDHRRRLGRTRRVCLPKTGVCVDA